ELVHVERQRTGGSEQPCRADARHHHHDAVVQGRRKRASVDVQSLHHCSRRHAECANEPCYCFRNPWAAAERSRFDGARRSIATNSATHIAVQAAIIAHAPAPPALSATIALAEDAIITAYAPS